MVWLHKFLSSAGGWGESSPSPRPLYPRKELWHPLKMRQGVGPIGGLDIVDQRRFSCPCRISTAGRPFCSLVTIPTIPAARLTFGTNWIIKRNFRLNEILKSRTWSVANVSLLVERVALEQVFHRWLCKVEGTWNGWPSYSNPSFYISGVFIRLFVCWCR